jgi:hypothetical protein
MLCLQKFDASLVTLIPKKDDASTLSDFSPISLLKCTLKIYTKLLAYRLHSVMLELIDKRAAYNAWSNSNLGCFPAICAFED